jgi:hypothetical protein
MKIDQAARSSIRLFLGPLRGFAHLELSAFREVTPDDRAKWAAAQLEKVCDDGGAVIALRDEEGLLGVAGARQLAFDTEHFGLSMGRIGPFLLAARATPADGRALARACGEQLTGAGVHFIDCRVPTADLVAARALEAAGFYLGDTQADYAFRVRGSVIPSVSNEVKLRYAAPADGPALEALTRETFTGYLDRFHRDPFFDAARATEMYVQWTANSLAGLADAILVAEIDGRIGGFLTLEIKHRQNEVVPVRFAEGVLAGVAPWTRGRGVYTSLLAGSLPWFAAHCDIGLVVTQIDNVAVQSAWVGLGYRLVQGRYTFHWRE